MVPFCWLVHVTCWISSSSGLVTFPGFYPVSGLLACSFVWKSTKHTCWPETQSQTQWLVYIPHTSVFLKPIFNLLDVLSGWRAHCEENIPPHHTQKSTRDINKKTNDVWIPCFHPLYGLSVLTYRRKQGRKSHAGTGRTWKLQRGLITEKGV